MSNAFDIIVLGLGAMGSASVFQLAKKGKRVLGIDQFRPPHTLGSSHGDTRVIRQAIGEGEEYVPLVLRSYELWREIENATGLKLLETVGGLIMGRASSSAAFHGSEDFLQTTISSAKKFGIAHSLWDANQIRSRFPQFNLIGDEYGYYEPEMGFLRPELAIDAQLTLAQTHGAEIRMNERVLEVLPDSSEVRIRTAGTEYTTEQVVISAGAWLPKLLGPDLAKHFEVSRQVLFWFGAGGGIEQFLPGRFPVFIWKFSGELDDFIYGIPAIDRPSGGIKLGTEQHVVQTTADAVDRTVSNEEAREFYDKHVRNRLPGLSSQCVKATACLYTSTRDSGFIIDFHPVHRNMLIVSPCSGHGFKHSAAIGEIVSDLMTSGQSRINTDKFKWSRLAGCDR